MTGDQVPNRKDDRSRERERERRRSRERSPQRKRSRKDLHEESENDHLGEFDVLFHVTQFSFQSFL